MCRSSIRHCTGIPLKPNIVIVRVVLHCYASLCGGPATHDNEYVYAHNDVTMPMHLTLWLLDIVWMQRSETNVIIRIQCNYLYYNRICGQMCIGHFVGMMNMRLAPRLSHWLCYFLHLHKCTSKSYLWANECNMQMMQQQQHIAKRKLQIKFHAIIVGVWCVPVPVRVCVRVVVFSVCYLQSVRARTSALRLRTGNTLNRNNTIIRCKMDTFKSNLTR